MAKRQELMPIWALPGLTEPGVADPRRLEAALAAAEAALGVTISIQDHAALFLDAAGEPALPEPRRRHQRPFCDGGRERPGFDQACLAHCAGAVPEVASGRHAPFVHRCWKGAAEIVVPVHHEGTHLCTLFAGTWRGDHLPHGPAAAGLPLRLEQLRQALPPVDRSTLERLAGPLQLLGAGLVALWLPHLRLGGEADRGSTIHRFLHLRVHEDIRLGDLARHLGLSPSRTGALVRERLGCSFQDAVLRERIRRARALLRHTRQPVKVIAERVGFHSEYYFNRAFRRIVGEAPGRWRRSPAP